MDKIDYKKIAYLLGCYMVIVDKVTIALYRYHA